jgi:cyclin A
MGSSERSSGDCFCKEGQRGSATVQDHGIDVSAARLSRLDLRQDSLSSQSESVGQSTSLVEGSAMKGSPISYGNCFESGREQKKQRRLLNSHSGAPTVTCLGPADDEDTDEEKTMALFPCGTAGESESMGIKRDELDLQMPEVDSKLDMVVTRAMRKRLEADALNGMSILPKEIWIHVISFLPYKDVGKMLCTCSALYEDSKEVWKQACRRTWPKWTKYAEMCPDSVYDNVQDRWKKCYEMLSLREEELELVINTDKFGKIQKKVTRAHRYVLTEWMSEVACEWKLESSVIFQAVRFLDYYLSKVAVEDLSKFQVLGLGCLRLAVDNYRHQMTISDEDYASLLDPVRYANVSDGAGTVEQVIEATEKVGKVIPESMLKSPNAKMYLRCLWFRLMKTGLLTSNEMHIYILASFLLELSNQELKTSGVPHSMLAAAAMSISLQKFTSDPWPVQLQAFGSYSLECLKAPRMLFALLQKHLPCHNLRRIWNGYYKDHAYEECSQQWDDVLSMMSQPSDDIFKLLNPQNELDAVTPLQYPIILSPSR